MILIQTHDRFPSYKTEHSVGHIDDVWKRLI